MTSGTYTPVYPAAASTIVSRWSSARVGWNPPISRTAAMRYVVCDPMMNGVWLWP
jgi:hypothetical protein